MRLGKRLSQLLDDLVPLILLAALCCDLLRYTLSMGFSGSPCRIDIGLHLSGQSAMRRSVLGIHVSHKPREFLAIQSFICG